MQNSKQELPSFHFFFLRSQQIDSSRHAQFLLPARFECPICCIVKENGMLVCSQCNQICCHQCLQSNNYYADFCHEGQNYFWCFVCKQQVEMYLTSQLLENMQQSQIQLPFTGPDCQVGGSGMQNYLFQLALNEKQKYGSIDFNPMTYEYLSKYHEQKATAISLAQQQMMIPSPILPSPNLTPISREKDDLDECDDNCKNSTEPCSNGDSNQLSSPLLLSNSSESNSTQNPQQQMCILQRDSKNIHIIDIVKGSSQIIEMKCSTPFPHNFQCVNSPSGQTYMVGGGNMSSNDESLCSLFEVFPYRNHSMQFERRASMKYPRNGHSACWFSDKFIVVTGSRKLSKHTNFDCKCEIYNSDLDFWLEIAFLNFGRYYHSSCGFGNKAAYVFGGILSESDEANLSFTNSIEQYVFAQADKWTLIEISETFLLARQGAGMIQVNNDKILIFGGFSGYFLKDAYFLDTNSYSLCKTEPLPQAALMFQMGVAKNKFQIVAFDIFNSCQHNNIANPEDEHKLNANKKSTGIDRHEYGTFLKYNFFQQSKWQASYLNQQ